MPPASNSFSDTGLPSNLAAGICAVFWLLGGVIFYLIEKKDQFVRHWAVESIFFGATWFVVMAATSILSGLFRHFPFIGHLMAALIGLAGSLLYICFLILWILGIIKAFQGQRWEYPVVSQQCRRLFPNFV